MIQENDFECGVELPLVNRGAVVLEPTEDFLKWINESIEGTKPVTLDELREDMTVYLIPEYDFDKDAEIWLKRNYRAILDEELFSWNTDPGTWPEDRSFKKFRKFFGIRFCSMVLDMDEGAIERDNE